MLDERLAELLARAGIATDDQAAHLAELISAANLREALETTPGLEERLSAADRERLERYG